MRLLALAVVAGLLFSPVAEAQIRATTDAYGPFSSATFVQDPQSNIVMTLQRETWRNGYGVDFRGMRTEGGPWEVEYFCEPDTVLLVGTPGRDVHAYYLPYLTWIDDLFLSDSLANAAARRTPSMGTFASELPAEVAISSPPVDITEYHLLREGAGFVQSVVSVKNRSDTPQPVTYVYQDGAFMWFPDGDQRHVESIRISAALSGAEVRVNRVWAGTTPIGSWQFVGTFNRKHGVVAGIVTTDPTDVAGISDNYIGVQQLVRDGTPYFVPRKHPVIPQGAGGDVREATYDIRFIALDFGILQPGEEKQRSFNRIMTVLPLNHRNQAGIVAWVEQMVRRIMS